MCSSSRLALDNAIGALLIRRRSRYFGCTFQSKCSSFSGISLHTSLSSTPTNGRNNNVLVMLNIPWVNATCIFTFMTSHPPAILATSSIKNGKMPLMNNGRKINVPNVLNNRLIKDVRFAFSVVPKPAKSAVTVVPILLPNSIGTT